MRSFTGLTDEMRIRQEFLALRVGDVLQCAGTSGELVVYAISDSTMGRHVQTSSLDAFRYRLDATAGVWRGDWTVTDKPVDVPTLVACTSCAKPLVAELCAINKRGMCFVCALSAASELSGD